MKNAFQTVRQPVITEKAAIQREDVGVYCFRVHPKANKVEAYSVASISGTVPGGQIVSSPPSSSAVPISSVAQTRPRPSTCTRSMRLFMSSSAG